MCLAMEGDKIAGKRRAHHHRDASPMLESIFCSFNLLYKISVAVFFALAGIGDLCRMQNVGCVFTHVLWFKLNSFSFFYDFSTRQSIYAVLLLSLVALVLQSSVCL